MAERNSLHRILGPPARLVRAVLPTVLGRVAVYRTFLRRELTNGPRIDIPWRRRLWLYRRGFTSETGEAYGIDEGNYRDVVSTIQHERADSITEPWDAAVNNKLLFRLLYGSFSAHLPTLYGLLDGGTLTRNSPVMTVPSWQADGPDRTGTVGQGGVARFDAVPWIDAHLAENDALVLKPVYGYGGRGVLVCRKVGSDGYDVNGERKTTAAFAALVEGLEEYLAWDFVGNGEYVGRLYPDATGTVRVPTMWDYARDEPFVAAAVQRIGSDASRPPDNFDRGRLTAEVDETGALGPGARWYPERGGPDRTRGVLVDEIVPGGVGRRPPPRGRRRPRRGPTDRGPSSSRRLSRSRTGASISRSSNSPSRARTSGGWPGSARRSRCRSPPPRPSSPPPTRCAWSARRPRTSST